MVPLFHCEVCRSKVLQTRLKKHHQKVHPDQNYDIYTSMAPENTGNVEYPAQKVTSFDTEKPEKGLTSNDEQMVHVRCEVCRNCMPAMDLSAHMKRKHNHTNEQVDAIGKMAEGLSIKETSFHSMFSERIIETAPLRYVHDLAQPALSDSDATNVIALQNSKSSTESIFYSLRVTEAQMQQLLNQNRIYPKDGHFYLKP